MRIILNESQLINLFEAVSLGDIYITNIIVI